MGSIRHCIRVLGPNGPYLTLSGLSTGSSPKVEARKLEHWYTLSRKARHVRKLAYYMSSFPTFMAFTAYPACRKKAERTNHAPESKFVVLPTVSKASTPHPTPLPWNRQQPTPQPATLNPKSDSRRPCANFTRLGRALGHLYIFPYWA